MVAAIAFACIRSDGMSVRRVEFTPEFKVCLPFLRFAGLGDEPLDTAPIEEDGAVRVSVEQHLRVAYRATASIALPSLVSLRYASRRGLTDPTICLRGFGICLQEYDWPSGCPTAVDYWNEPHAVTRALDRLASVVDYAARNDEGGNDHRTARRGHSPFSFVEKNEDPFGNDAAREGCGDLKIVSERRVRALLLLELPSYGNKCHLRLYTGP